MAYVAYDSNDPRRLAVAAETIVELAERLPDIVNELERTREKQPAPCQACALLMMRNTLESLFATLGDLYPDSSTPAKRPDAER